MRDETMTKNSGGGYRFDRLRAEGLITDGTYGPFIDPDKVIAFIDAHRQPTVDVESAALDEDDEVGHLIDDARRRARQPTVDEPHVLRCDFDCDACRDTVAAGIAVSLATLVAARQPTVDVEALVAEAYSNGYRDGLDNEVDDWGKDPDTLAGYGRDYARVALAAQETKR